MKGWIGFDLDGTLAHYDGWDGIEHIGYPIKPICDIAKQMIADGKDVRIFTARVYGSQKETALVPIQKWCLKHLGKVLPVTNEKDFGMILLYDDRCVQVETNTGKLK